MATYRPLTEAHIDEAVAMMQEFYAIDGYPMDVLKSRVLFGQFVRSPQLGKAWLIEVEGKTVGYVILTFVFSFEFGGTIAFIDELYLRKEFRGKGIGKASISFVRQQANDLGLKRLYLEVERHNSAAQKLYLDAGFTKHHRDILTLSLEKQL